MRLSVQKWGNSLAVRIPKPFAESLGLTVNSEVEIMIKEGRLELVPLTKISLESLLAGITPDNLHSEQDTGSPVGNETW